MRAGDLLPEERALAGDPEAERQLIDRVARPLEQAGGGLLETVETYLETGGVLEACASSSSSTRTPCDTGCGRPRKQPVATPTSPVTRWCCALPWPWDACHAAVACGDMIG